MLERAPQTNDVRHFSEEQFSSFNRLLERIPAGAYTCDSDGLITYYNSHAERLWGRAPKLNNPEDRYCGSFKLFAVDGSPVPHDECWMALAIKQRKEFNGHEIIIEALDGHQVAVLAHASPIHDASGKLLGAINVLVDISERKAAEKALSEAGKRKDEFLATLAHELRNPLAPIRNAVEYLRLKGPVESDLQWAMDVIARQLEHMTRLVDDLLDVSRIARGKLELRRQRVDLMEIVRAAEETSRPIIEARDQRLTISAPSRPIYLEADAARLAQAISNLLNNAAKYTEPGGDILLVAGMRDASIVITVKDTGVGIPQEMLPHIFDMFMQVNRSRDRAQGGLGIGLTLVKRLVESHGGSIEAHSDGPGNGSEFIIRLPAQAMSSLRQPGTETEHSPAASPLRILIVDDNVDAAITLETLLRLRGNLTRLAHDSIEALAAATELRPDVALLDLRSPKLDGYQLAKKIRLQSWGSSVSLVALTSFGDDQEDRRCSKTAEFDHHLVKPVDPGALMQLLAHLQSQPRTPPTGPH